jgi:hypothetical protein
MEGALDPFHEALHLRYCIDLVLGCDMYTVSSLEWSLAILVTVLVLQAVSGLYAVRVLQAISRLQAVLVSGSVTYCIGILGVVGDTVTGDSGLCVLLTLATATLSVLGCLSLSGHCKTKEKEKGNYI